MRRNIICSRINNINYTRTHKHNNNPTNSYKTRNMTWMGLFVWWSSWPSHKQPHHMNNYMNNSCQSPTILTNPTNSPMNIQQLHKHPLLTQPHLFDNQSLEQPHVLTATSLAHTPHKWHTCSTIPQPGDPTRMHLLLVFDGVLVDKTVSKSGVELRFWRVNTIDVSDQWPWVVPQQCILSFISHQYNIMDNASLMCIEQLIKNEQELCMVIECSMLTPWLTIYCTDQACNGDIETHNI